MIRNNHNNRSNKTRLRQPQQNRQQHFSVAVEFLPLRQRRQQQPSRRKLSPPRMRHELPKPKPQPPSQQRHRRRKFQPVLVRSKTSKTANTARHATRLPLSHRPAPSSSSRSSATSRPSSCTSRVKWAGN